jgi:hypothetical protein
MTGKDRSALVLLVSLSCGVAAAQETLLSDPFARANSASVGNGWIEIEATGAAVGISNNRLTFVDTSDVVRRPMVVHTFAAAASGLLVWHNNGTVWEFGMSPGIKDAIDTKSVELAPDFDTIPEPE